MEYSFRMTTKMFFTNDNISMRPFCIFLNVLWGFMFFGCSGQRNQVPVTVYGNDIEIQLEQFTFISQDSVLELKSYSTTSYFEQDSIKGVISYNRFTHALDFMNLSGEKVISSIRLQREGPDGISGRINSICPVAIDSIWAYDGQFLYLINADGHVSNKLEFKNKEEIIIQTNHAMNTAKFMYNGNNHSLLYLRHLNGIWMIEEYGFEQGTVINRYRLEYSVCNPMGKKSYADLEAPNINFSPQGIVYNYTYESTVYVLDTITRSTQMYGGASRYTSNFVKEFDAMDDYSAWRRHGIENTHFYDVMYLSDYNLFVRPHLGGADMSLGKNFRELGDGRLLYLTFFDEHFNVVVEFCMERHKFSYFTGWCALPDALLLYEDNSLSEEVDYDHLVVDLVFPMKGFN